MTGQRVESGRQKRPRRSDSTAQSLPVADYGASSRPSKILDVMHEAVTRYQDPAIAFFPLIDAIILLLGKPLALIFHRQAQGSSQSEPIFLTYPEVDLSEMKSTYLKDSSLAATLIEVPAPAGVRDRFFISLANIREEQDDAADGFSRRLQLDPYRVAAATTEVNRPPTGLHGERLDVWLLRRLFYELQATCSGRSRLSLDVLSALHDGLSSRISPRESEKAVSSPWDDDELPEWEKTRDAMMDQHWREILDQSLPRFTRRDGVAGNMLVRERLSFLCVFRFALPGTRRRFGKFDYGARIVLSRRQLAAIREWLGSAPVFRTTSQGTSEEKANLFKTEFACDPKAVIRALELPLGMNYRSISDTHFGSGFIDFAPEATYAKEGPRSGPTLEARDRTEGTDDPELQNDRLRKVAERLVLDEIGSRVFYVPIHVGGIPWLGLLILEDEVRGADVADASWEESYHLYRGPVTTIGQQLRLSSHNAYSSALCAAVNQELTTLSRDVFPEINRRWQKLSAFFPFEVGTLTQTEHAPHSIAFPAGKRAVLASAPNPNSCFRRALNFDRLRLPTLQHDLKTVLETVVAKRLSALALQESAWAHDVKNWTNPILTELFSLWQGGQSDKDGTDGLYRALVHARILNATAYARQTSGPSQREGKPGQDALDTYLAFASSPDLEKLLSLVIDLLLATHGENPDNQSRFDLEWPGKRPVRAVLAELSKLLGDGGQHSDDGDPTSVIGLPAVIWPLSLLREVIHNIDINTPLAKGIPDGSRVLIDYRVTRNADEAVICISQRNLEAESWENKFPNGLRKANRLYGPDGANVGWIEEDPDLDQREIEVLTSSGSPASAVRISYALCIRFFLGGAGNARS